ncbi:MAG: DUF4292 domain-containing protein, partial [Bacteroidota bacterium]
KENLQAIWLSPGNWKVMTLEFIDVETNRKFIAGYNDFRTVGNFLVPFKHIYSISAEKNIKANMEWTKFNSNEPVTFPYKIPSSYDEIKINEKK